MRLSIVIPVYNEAENIGPLIRFLKQHGQGNIEIIVSDGGSSDSTVSVAEKASAIAVSSPQKGRAAQMNYGASLATGSVLYFVHADTFPDASFYNDIRTAIAQGYQLGRYRTKFLSTMPLLRLNEWATRFDFFICMGGDQTLFIQKEFFTAQGGFKTELMIMEEYEFCARARTAGGRYKIMNGAAKVSARKYEKNTWLQVQRANYTAVSLYKKGASQQQIAATYKKLLRW